MAIIWTHSYGYDNAESSLHMLAYSMILGRSCSSFRFCMYVFSVDALLTVCLKIVDFSHCGIVAGYVSICSGVVMV